ncbi:uncharacterized protein ACOB6Z_003461 [Ctenodactylus gundi]
MAATTPLPSKYKRAKKDQKNLTPEVKDSETHVGNTRLASSNSKFAFSLYKQLAQTYPSKNIVFSPVSVSTALAFVSLGARGTTLTEILEGLRFNLTETPEAEIHQGFQHLLRTLRQPSDQLQLSTGNAMFITEQIEALAKFMEDAQELYAAQAFRTNFQDSGTAKRVINDFVEKETQGKIRDLIKDLDTDTKMVLVNYIYFKAKWKTPFDPRDTHKLRFYVSKDKWVEVPMMSMESKKFPYFRDEALSCTVVEMKYTGKASALFILPDEGKMEAVEGELNPETLRRWRDSLQMTRIDELYVPKFYISGNYYLEKLLPLLGIREVFSTEADLSGVTGAKGLQVSEVVHNAVLDVAELGTEAAAATGMKVVPLMCINNSMIVSFDKPFLMAIVHADTQSVLFLNQKTLDQENKDSGTNADSSKLVSRSTDFAFSLYKQLAQMYPSKNIAFSPLSICTGLASVSLGARGTTLTEILEGLRFNLTETPEAEIHQGFQHLLRTLRQPSDHPQLCTGNAMFITEQLEVLAKFMEDAQELFAAQAFPTNFQDPTPAERLINDFVKKETQGKIGDLVKGLDTGTKMVLVNYICFKGKWKTCFNPSFTSESKFYVSKDRWVKVPMMSTGGVKLPHFQDEELSCTVVEMKYLGDASALFILPDEDKMEVLEATLLPETLRRWRSSLKTRSIDYLYLPKFSISSDYSLEHVLPLMGIREVFSDQADLSGVTGSKDLKLSQVAHKAKLDVDEEGARATAVTEAEFCRKRAKRHSLTVRFDRPFLMAIVHAHTQSILFLSKITNPTET